MTRLLFWIVVATSIAALIGWQVGLRSDVVPEEIRRAEVDAIRLLHAQSTPQPSASPALVIEQVSPDQRPLTDAEWDAIQKCIV